MAPGNCYWVYVLLRSIHLNGAELLISFSFEGHLRQADSQRIKTRKALGVCGTDQGVKRA